MITAAQLRAARAMLGIDQKTLADMAGVSVPTVQRMEARRGNVKGAVESLTRVIDALDRKGIEFLYAGSPGTAGGRGVRFKASFDGGATRERNVNDGTDDVNG